MFLTASSFFQHWKSSSRHTGFGHEWTLNCSISQDCFLMIHRSCRWMRATPWIPSRGKLSVRECAPFFEQIFCLVSLYDNKPRSCKHLGGFTCGQTTRHLFEAYPDLRWPDLAAFPGSGRAFCDIFACLNVDLEGSCCRFGTRLHNLHYLVSSPAFVNMQI